MLHRFAGGSDGAYPQAPILPGRQAVLFGSTAVRAAGAIAAARDFPKAAARCSKMRARALAHHRCQDNDAGRGSAHGALAVLGRA